MTTTLACSMQRASRRVSKLSEGWEMSVAFCGALLRLYLFLLCGVFNEENVSSPSSFSSEIESVVPVYIKVLPDMKHFYTSRCSGDARP